MDLDRPFRGDAARRELGWTWQQLRGPRVLRLFRGVYISALAVVDLGVRARAAVLLHPDAVVGGVAAGGLWGSFYDAVDTDVDLYVTASGARSQPGLVARRDRLRPDEIMRVDGLRVTTPARTAFDLARRLSLPEAVAALDALGRATPLVLDEVRAVAGRHPGVRGARAVERVLGLVDARSCSPAWSRARTVLRLRGVPAPEVGVRLEGPGGEHAVWLELAWPEVRFGLAALQAIPAPGTLWVSDWIVARTDPARAVERPDAFTASVRWNLRNVPLARARRRLAQETFGP